jgi:hypothetical protein
MMTEKKRHTRHGHMARVSKLALGDHALPVRFMYKTIPEHSNDTEFLAQFSNLEPFPLEPMCQADPSLDALLDQNAGSVWERLPDQPWQPVHNFEIPVEEVDVVVN